MIKGTTRQGTFPSGWHIPSDAKRPLDKRVIRDYLWQIVELQNGCIKKPDATRWVISIADTLECVQALVDTDYLIECQNSWWLLLSNIALAFLERKT